VEGQNDLAGEATNSCEQEAVFSATIVGNYRQLATPHEGIAPGLPLFHQPAIPPVLFSGIV
jgi:hypothetical protein